MNLYRMKNRLCRVVAAIGCCLLPFGCTQEEDETRVPEQGQDVSLQLQVRAAADNTGGTAPTAEEENKIHTLRVYAFAHIPGDSKDGRLVGYYYTGQVGQASHTFPMNITFYQKGRQDVKFYVVANEEAMSVPGVDKKFTEQTTEEELNKYTFTSLATDIANKGLPMFYRSEFPVSLTKNQLNNVPSFNLQRPMGKLGVFAAKPADETSTLRITGLTMLESGTRTRNYLMPQDVEKLKEITSNKGPATLQVIDGEVKALPSNLTEDDKKNPKYYTDLLKVPYYPFESPWGSPSWNAPGDEEGNVLQIDYTFDGGEPRTGWVYLPCILRNHYYAICCLMHNDGKITVECRVADWNDGGTDDLDFDYPSYTNPITPNGSSEPLPEGKKYPQPTVYYNSDANSDKGPSVFDFKIWAPKDKKEVWRPVLYTRHPGDFEVEVYQGGQKVETVNGSYPTSPDSYQIRVKALTNQYLFDTGDGTLTNKIVGLGIAYQPAWAPDSNSLLLINGLTNSLKWEGSDQAEIIEIKQVDIPVIN